MDNGMSDGDENQQYYYEKFADLMVYDPFYGRRGKCSPDMVKAIIEAIGAGLSNADAARAMEISPGTLSSWRRRGHNEFQRITKLEMDTGEMAEVLENEKVYLDLFLKSERARPLRKLLLLEQIRNAGLKQWQANAWLLERQYPGEFGRKTRIEVDDYRSKIVELIRDGTLGDREGQEMIEGEFNEEDVEGLFKRAGVALPSGKQS